MNIHDFLYYNKSDRNTILVLLGIAVAALLVCFLFDNNDETLSEGYTQTQQFPQKHFSKNQSSSYYDVETHPHELFPFDPNTADSTALLRLGLQPWQVRAIYKYRARGGVYRQPSDFARLYGLTQQHYRQLKPYIRIGQDYQPAALLPEAQRRKTTADSLYPHTIQKLKLGETIDLNTADTTLLQRVPGIGHYYAQRIVYYRGRLGGFNDVNQLQEINGFPTEAIKYFKADCVHITKLNVNRMTFSDLQHHPYIGFYRARDIMDYRRLRGPLRSINDLKLLKSFTPEAIDRLRAYVVF
ncbi:MAG: helix-hairpin-helix domain-containing protein [Prevotella salivae]|nr:helix-hairpin-helix domain-containing protein [Segatella salivae]